MECCMCKKEVKNVTEWEGKKFHDECYANGYTEKIIGKWINFQSRNEYILEKSGRITYNDTKGWWSAFGDKIRINIKENKLYSIKITDFKIGPTKRKMTLMSKKCRYVFYLM